MTEFLEYKNSINKVEEIINIGSIYLSLKSKYITGYEVLQYLYHFHNLSEDKEDKNVSIDKLNAYRFACDEIHPNEQYISIKDKDSDDKYHFIYLCPYSQYIGIFLTYDTDLYLPVSKSRTDTISHILIPKLKELHKDHLQSEYYRFLIGDITFNIPVNETFFDEGFFFNNNNVIDIIIRCDYNDIYDLRIIKNDFIYKIKQYDKFNKIDNNFINAVIIRCNYLAEIAPNYWKNVVYKKYLSFFEEAFLYINVEIPINESNQEITPLIKSSDLQPLKILFPTLINDKILNLSPLAKEIYFMPFIVKCYYLGLPFEYMVLTEQNILDKLYNLSTNGIQKYYDEFLIINKRRYQNNNITNLFVEENNLLLGNNQDTLYEDPLSYSPFDILKYIDGNHLYYFTRPEFKKLVDMNKNIWTNKTLSGMFGISLKSKIIMEQYYKLPVPQPLNDLLQTLESSINNGNGVDLDVDYYESSECPESESECPDCPDCPEHSNNSNNSEQSGQSGQSNDSNNNSLTNEELRDILKSMEYHFDIV